MKKDLSRSRIIISLFLYILTKLVQFSKSLTVLCIDQGDEGNDPNKRFPDTNSDGAMVLIQALIQEKICDNLKMSDVFGSVNLHHNFSRFIGFSSYVKYESVDSVKLETEIKGEFIKPLINVIQVNEEAVWFKGFKSTWSLALTETEQKPWMRNIFSMTNKTGRITSFYHYDGLKKILLGLENLEVQIFDLEKIVNGENFLKAERVIDVSYKMKKGEEQIIDFITGIPRTDNVIVAPSRFEILKINYLTGEKYSFNNPIDQIKHLIIPFSRNRIKEEYTVSSKSFIATAKHNHVNFVGDYTTMTPIRFFTLRTPRIYLETQQKVSSLIVDRVDAIEFYGYYPKSQYYLMSNKELPYVYLYTTTFNKFDDYETLIHNITTLSWIEGLTYIFYSDSVSNCGFWIVHQYEGNPERKIQICKKNYKATKAYKLIVMEIKGKIEGKRDIINIPMVSLSDDYLLLGWEQPNVLKEPPVLMRPECKSLDKESKLGGLNIPPVYSAYLTCDEFRIGKNIPETWTTTMNENEGEYFVHQISKCDFCTNRYVPTSTPWMRTYIFQENTNSSDSEYYISSLNELPNNESRLILVQKFPDQNYFDKKEEIEKTFEKGGCATGFSQNDLGICQNCPSFVVDERAVIGAILQCSNCYTHRTPKSKILEGFFEIKNYRQNFFFCFEFNPFGYSKSKAQYDTIKGLKPLPDDYFKYEATVISDWADSEDLYKIEKVENFEQEKNYNNKFYNFMNYGEIIPTFFGTTFFPQERRFKECLLLNLKVIYDHEYLYSLSVDLENGLKLTKALQLQREVIAIPGYTTTKIEGTKSLESSIYEYLAQVDERMENDPDFNQKMKNGEIDFDYKKFREMRFESYYTEGKFNYGCSSNCTIGYYYNSSAMSCLQCRYGCSLCKEFENCDSCIAGYKKINGSCYNGCPKGYYVESFDGRCYKCREGCDECKDDIKIKTKFKDDFQGRCLICSSKGDMVDLNSGKCVKKCDEGKNEEEDEYGTKYCLSCSDPNCSKCSVYNLDECLNCKEDYEYNDVYDKCLKKKVQILTILIFAFVILFIVVLVSFIALIFFESKNREVVKKSWTKNEEEIISLKNLEDIGSSGSRRGENFSEEDIPEEGNFEKLPQEKMEKYTQSPKNLDENHEKVFLRSLKSIRVRKKEKE